MKVGKDIILLVLAGVSLIIVGSYMLMQNQPNEKTNNVTNVNNTNNNNTTNTNNVDEVNATLKALEELLNESP